MSAPDFTGLKAATKVKKDAWVPPGQEDLVRGRVLAFDPSLAATGWVLLERNEWGLYVRNSGTIRSAEDSNITGPDRMVAGAITMYDSLRQVMTTQLTSGTTLAHERPPSPSKMVRPESALVSTTVIRCIAHAMSWPHIRVCDARQAKKMICGNANAKKPQAHSALRGCFGWIDGSAQVTNESKRDALLVGMLALHKDHQ